MKDNKLVFTRRIAAVLKFKVKCPKCSSRDSIELPTRILEYELPLEELIKEIRDTWCADDYSNLDRYGSTHKFILEKKTNKEIKREKRREK